MSKFGATMGSPDLGASILLVDIIIFLASNTDSLDKGT